MQPISAVAFKGGFVVIGDDGSVERYDRAKKRWTTLVPVPGTAAAGNKFKRKKRLRQAQTPLTPSKA